MGVEPPDGYCSPAHVAVHPLMYPRCIHVFCLILRFLFRYLIL